MTSTPAANLEPGTQLRHRGGDVVTLARRKRPRDDYDGLSYRPGWWLTDSTGGLADFVIDAENSDWEVLA